MIEYTQPGVVRITVPIGAIQTDQAQDIKSRILPEFILMFLEKNRKYAKVDNALGSKGVFPDVYRKVGILKDRVWDESDVVGESTREVAMDLIGHLLLMIHMMDKESDRNRIVDREAYMASRVSRAMRPIEDTMLPVFEQQEEADSKEGARDYGANYGHADEDEPPSMSAVEMLKNHLHIDSEARTSDHYPGRGGW